MRRSLLLTSSITALLLGGSAVSAEGMDGSDFYISLFGGVSGGLNSPFILDDYLYDTQSKAGFSIGGAFGQYLTPSVRGELELSYQRYATDSYSYTGNSGASAADGYVQSVNLLLNVWKDIDLGASFTPYVGAGLGASIGTMSIDWDGNEVSRGSNIGFASQLGAGVRMSVSERMEFDIGYRIRSIYGLVATDEKATDITLANLFSHSLRAGFSYRLGDDPGAMNDGDAMAENGSDVYYTLFGGLALPQDSVVAAQTYTYEVNNKAGFTMGAAVGTSLLPDWRGELEAAYTHYAHYSNTYYANESPDSMSGATSLYTLTANVWKDIPIGRYTTYIGGGVGFGIADADGTLDDVTIDGSGIGLALQFGAGMRRAISEDWAIDIGYRARGVYGAIIDGVGDDEHARGSYLSHMLQVGFTYGHDMFAAPKTNELSSPGHYATLFGGVALREGSGTAYNTYTYEMNFDTGFTVGAALGTQITDTMRGELELSYMYADSCGARYLPEEIKCDDEDWKGLLHTVDLLANVWKDFDVGVVSPYVGGGLGLALVLPDIDEWADPRVAMAAQIGGGVRYAIKDDLTLDLGYRFKGIFDALASGHDTDGADDEHAGFTYYSHAVTGGLTWDF